MSCDITGQLVYLFSLEAIPVTESDHEVLDDQEVSIQVVAVSEVEMGKLFPDVVGEDREEDGVFFDLDHAVPRCYEQFKDLASEAQATEGAEN